MERVILFDVNETLLDLEPVRRYFGDDHGDAELASAWFRELLRLSFVHAAIDEYVPFTDLAGSALRSCAGRSVSESDLAAMAMTLRSLSPHADVVPSLERLLEAGHRLAAVTNSPQDAAEAQLANAGVSGFFDVVMSVEAVGRFKPHASVYHEAARRMGVETSDCTMVAAHDWDIAGAMACGCTGVFLSRPGQSWSSAFAEPDHSAPDLSSATDWLLTG